MLGIVKCIQPTECIRTSPRKSIKKNVLANFNGTGHLQCVVSLVRVLINYTVAEFRREQS